MVLEEREKRSKFTPLIENRPKIRKNEIKKMIPGIDFPLILGIS